MASEGHSESVSE